MCTTFLNHEKKWAMFPSMKWYEKIFNIRVNITIFRVRFGSGYEYRNYLTELWNVDLSDVNTDCESSEDDSVIFFSSIRK